MAFQNFLIAPLKSGTQTNKKPWLIADDAYELLRNVYNWRGRIKKRFGARPMEDGPDILPTAKEQFTRLRLEIGTTNGVGDFVSIVPGLVDPLKFGQMFSVFENQYTVPALGTPVQMLNTGAFGEGEFNTTIGLVVFLGEVQNSAVYYYPANPVMHIALFQEESIITERTIVFDTNFAYEYQLLGWDRSGTGLWTGTDHDFHSSTNYRAAQASDYNLYVVNNVSADGIQYYDSVNWNTLPPPVTNAAGDTLLTALIITTFKNVLITFGTREMVGANELQFKNRIRWCKQYGDPTAVDSWRSDIKGLGDFLDAPTNEAIIAVESLKDRLIIFFQSSTYELVFTGNPVQLFQLQKINTELGVESTNSIIPFDKVVIGMGSVGIHACNGLNVERIDVDIPDTVFDISNTKFGPQRVQGIRDYFEELAYFSYSSDEANYLESDTFPNRVLVLDYIGNTWSYSDDSITALGYYHLPAPLDNIIERKQSQFRSVLAGNQQGFMFILTPNLPRNSMSLQITNITQGIGFVTLTVINHNFNTRSPYIFINNITPGPLVGPGFNNLNNTIQEVVYVDKDTIRINTNLAPVVNPYRGGGTIERVSQMEIKTKEYNFNMDSDERWFIPWVDFYVDRTASGQITVDYITSTSTAPVVQDSIASGAILGTNILETSPYPSKPSEALQDRFYHRVYFQQDGEVVQLHFYMSNEQMLSLSSITNGFELNAMIFGGMSTGTFI